MLEQESAGNFHWGSVKSGEFVVNGKSNIWWPKRCGWSLTVCCREELQDDAPRLTVGCSSPCQFALQDHCRSWSFLWTIWVRYCWSSVWDALRSTKIESQKSSWLALFLHFNVADGEFDVELGIISVEVYQDSISWSNIGYARGVENEKEWVNDRALWDPKQNIVEFGGVGAHTNRVGSASQKKAIQFNAEAVMPNCTSRTCWRIYLFIYLLIISHFECHLHKDQWTF